MRKVDNAIAIVVEPLLISGVGYTDHDRANE